MLQAKAESVHKMLDVHTKIAEIAKSAKIVKIAQSAKSVQKMLHVRQNVPKEIHYSLSRR